MGWLELLIGGAIGWFVIAPMVSPIVHQGINMLQGAASNIGGSSAYTRRQAYPAFGDLRGRGVGISGRPAQYYQHMRAFPAQGRLPHYRKMRSFN